MPQRPIIGIVGGIGAGKSLVAQIFSDLGAAHIDADTLTREAFEAASVKDSIRLAWGNEVFEPDGRVNREKLSERVFASRSDLRRLEAIVHPWIGRRRKQLYAAIARRDDVKAVALDSPLLFEANADFECDYVVFVDCCLETRAQRLAGRHGWDKQELVKRESKQLPLDFKRNRADYIVDNNSDTNALRRKVESVFSRIICPAP